MSTPRFRLHSRAVRLLMLTLLYYGGGLTFAYAESQAEAGSSQAGSGARAGAVARTGSIQGDVVDSATGAPVARARVGLMPIQAADHRSLQTTTDADGKFAFARVPAGEYAWWVRKSGYHVAPSGGRPTLRGMTKNRIVVSAKPSSRLRVSLAPASVLVGRVLAPDGEPIEKAGIALFRVPSPGARPRPVESSSAIETNDAGEFRISRVAPGSYLLMAKAGQSYHWGDGGMLVDTWHPGTASMAGATPLVVTQGSVMSGLDITLQDVRPVTVSGTVLNRAGQPMELGNVEVFTERDGARVSVPLASGSDDDLGPDGTFQLRLPPGEYWITASKFGRDGGLGEFEVPSAPDLLAQDMRSILAAIRKEMQAHAGSVSMKVSVGGEALDGLVLKLEPLVSIPGRKIFEGREPAMETFMSTSVRLQAAAGSSGCQDQELAGLDFDPGPTFEILALPGTCVPTVTAPAGWYLKAVQLDGVDVTQGVVKVEQGKSSEEMLAIFTDRRNELTFNVSDARGNATKEYVAIVFPVDESLWPVSRDGMSQTVRFHAPRSDGGTVTGAPPNGTPQGPHTDYSEPLAGLVPGEYYAIAIEDAEWDDLVDPAMLRRLSEKAIKFRLGEGETRILDLKRIELTTGF